MDRDVVLCSNDRVARADSRFVGEVDGLLWGSSADEERWAPL